MALMLAPALLAGAKAGAAGLMTGAAAAATRGIFGGGEKRQIRQQQKLQDMQVKGSKELSEFQKQQELEMWEKTNYAAQREQLEKAGLSVSMMYGGGGGGGATTTGGGAVALPSSATADSPSSQMMAQNAQAQTALQTASLAADIKLKEAQARNLDAQAEKTAGIDTESATTTNELNKFDLSIQKMKSVEGIVKAWQWANDKVQVESEKANAEWEAYKAAGFEGNAYDRKDSPVARAIRAGLDKTVTELQNARKEGRIKDAETTIKRFEAGLAEQGISPNSPWWVKIIGDLLDKVGLNMNPGKRLIKGAINELK